MHWPQYTIIALMLIGAGHNLAKHGEPQNTKHNALTYIISVGIFAFILYKGGFFTGGN